MSGPRIFFAQFQRPHAGFLAIMVNPVTGQIHTTVTVKLHVEYKTAESWDFPCYGGFCLRIEKEEPGRASDQQVFIQAYDSVDGTSGTDGLGGDFIAVFGPGLGIVGQKTLPEFPCPDPVCP